MDLRLSNNFNFLFEEFSKSYKKSTPFEKHLILVPSFATEFYLKRKLAEDLGIFMNVEFSFLASGIKKLISLFYPEIKMQNQLDLSLELEEEITNLVDSFEKRNELSEEQDCFKPLYEYLKGSIGSKKLTAFSDSLASLYLQYGLYAESVHEDWNKKETLHWQQALWKKVTRETSFLTNPYQVLELEPKKIDCSLNVTLFGFNFVPKVYFQILEKLSSKINLQIYQLSPCRLFWTDIRSPYEKMALVSHLKRVGAKAKDLESISSYLSETNPLLASLSKLGRSWFHLLEEASFKENQERYLIQNEALEIDFYREYHEGLENEISKSPMTLLKYIQMDLLSLRKPNEKFPVKLDQSIGVHQATTYQREVEVLYDYLLDLFSKQKNLSQNEVMILVPEIEKYLPYIENQFKTSPFQVAFHDYPYSMRNSLLRGFNHLMELVNSRWDKKSLFTLFEHPLFRARFNLTHEQIRDWKSWVEETNIQWGHNLKHQQKILQRNYGDEEKQKTLHALSWEDFFNLMIDKLSKRAERTPFEFHLNNLDFSDVASLNTMAEIIIQLKKDLKPFEENQKAPFEEWGEYLISIIDSYFGEEYEESIEIKTLKKRVQEVAKLSNEKKNNLYPFESFWFYLKKDLSVFHTEIYSHQLEALSFYSLFSRPTRPAKVICALGLSDGIFPRNPMDNPLLEIDKFSSTSYRPIAVDQDRYQFLELLLLAQDALYLSYLGYSPETHREQLPSLFITELLTYLDRSYEIGNKLPSHSLLFNHPHLKFDARYYGEQNMHDEGFNLAKSYYLSSKKKALSRLTQDFNRKHSLKMSLGLVSQLKTLNLQNLNSFIRNPLQRALNDRFQIYIKEEKWENSEQNYVLTPLQKAILRKKQFQGEENLSVSSALPKGIFKEALQEQISEEFDSFDSYLDILGLKKESMVLIELREDILEPVTISPSHFLYPAIDLELSPERKIKLCGVIEQVTEKGLLSLSSSSFENIWCQWPTLLILSVLSTNHNLLFETNLYFIRSQKSFSFEISNPLEELKNFVIYYLMGHEQFLPFLPNWISMFTSKTVDELKQQMKSDLQSDYFNHPYAKSLLSQNELPEDKKLLDWQMLSQELFSKSLRFMQVIKS